MNTRLLCALILAWTLCSEAKPDEDLVAHYDFDDRIAADKSEHKNDGKIHGTVEFVKAGEGFALRLDGKTAYVDCGTGASLDTEKEATVMCWFNPDAELQGGLVTRSTSASWADERLVLSMRQPGGQLVWAIGDGRQSQFGQFPDTPAGIWTHIALTFDERRIMFYRNGRRIHALDQELKPSVKGVPMLIGRSQGLGAEFFKGLIDEVRVYKRALSEKEIGELYAQTKAGRISDTALAGVDAAQTKFIEGSPVTVKQYQTLVDEQFLPTRAEMSDFEMAEKLNLDLPALADVKKAYETKDAPALEKALAAYLRSKMGGMNITPTGKPPRDRGITHATKAEDWFKPEINLNGFTMRIGERGEQMNFYSSFIQADSGPGVELLPWIGTLTDAYIDTGDAKYVDRMLEFTRQFYHRCRPPAVRRSDWPWGGGSGPWSMGGSQRASGNYLPYLYRVIGNSPVVTDADRVMFLKMYWEHLDLMGQFAEFRAAWNFGPAHLYSHIVNLALYFPEFRDMPRWMKLVGQGFVHNMEDCVLDDGGTVERTGYNFGFFGPYVANYARLKDTPYALPDVFRRGLERNLEFSLWVLSPTLEYPLFGSSNLGPMDGVLDWGLKIFPERADLAYALSRGKTGAPPSRVARVLSHTGWLTMRSGWDTNALYMAMNYNGSPDDSAGTWENINSFAIWADGWPRMTDPGTTASYSEEEYYAWCTKTFSCNTVLVDNKSQGLTSNSGRLESWACLPDSGRGGPPGCPLPSSTAARPAVAPYQNAGGFTYCATVSDAYRRLGVTHRRAVLFVRPSYWLMYDVLTGDGKPHRYHWQGHFQPADVKMDTATKVVSAASPGGRPLWVIPARPEAFALEQKSGPIVTRDADPAIQPPLSPNRRIAPYMSLEKADAVEPFAFTVLLCPSDARPKMEGLPVTENRTAVGDAQAIGVRVRVGNHDDLLALSADGKTTLRRYGGQLSTDAESAYIRREKNQVVEAGLVNGRRLDYAGRKLIEVGPEVTSVHVRFTGGEPEIHAQGRGEVTVWKQSGWFARSKTTTTVGSSESLTLSPPQFSTKPEDLGKGIGLARPLALKDMVVVSWQTSTPSDATIEYDDVRTLNPEPVTAHRFVLSRLKDGQTYRLRITCRSKTGSINNVETTYTHQSP